MRLGWLGGVVLLAGVALPARAGQTFYVGPNNGTWSNGNNWDAGTPPAAGDDAVVGGFIPSRTGDVNVTFDANYTSSTALNSVTLDTTGATGSVILNQTVSGSALYATNEYIGNTTARNVYNQSDGSNTFTSGLYLGYSTNSSGTYNLSGAGSVTTSGNTSEYVGYSGSGTFNQTGGTHSSGALYIGYSGGKGIYTLSGGNLSAGGVAGVLNVGSTGTFTQSAGTNTVSSVFGGGGISVATGGTYNLSGGTLSVPSGGLSSTPPSGTITNSGTFNFSGGAISLAGSAAVFTNSGTFTVSGIPTITGTVGLTNNSGGTLHTAGTTVAFTSTVTNNGTYLSTGGSKQTFTSMTVGTTGILQATAGETFTVGNNLTNNSTQNTAFNLQAAQLTLSGSGVTHRVAWPGADLGATPAGYTNNFALGTLELTLGGSLALLDGNSTAGGGVYVHALMLDGGVAQIANIATSGGLNIYYDPNNATNGYLLGQTYPLSGGGFLEPAAVPEPGSLSLAVLGLSALGWRTVRRTMRCKG